MTKAEFLVIMAFLEAGCGKGIGEAAVEVYYQLLQDLPAAAFKAAAIQALAESQYPTFPPVGVLRRIAVELCSDNVPLPVEAWGQVRSAIVRYGYNGWLRAKKELHPLAATAAECIGWRSLCDSTEPEISRAQFVKAYESLAARDRRLVLMPPAVKRISEGLAASMALPDFSDGGRRSMRGSGIEAPLKRSPVEYLDRASRNEAICKS
jgi:hypothetical protein